MQPVVVDTQMVGEFVDDGDHHFVSQDLEVAAHVAQRKSVERDSIGQIEPAVVLPFGPRNAFVQAEQILLRVFVVDHDHDVVEQVQQLVRQRIDGVSHECFESVDVDGLHRHSLPHRCRSTWRGWEPLVEVE